MPNPDVAPTLIVGPTAAYIFASIVVREQITVMADSRDKSLALTKLDELDFWAMRAAAVKHAPSQVVPQ